MKKFEMPKIQVVKFACDSEAITTSSYEIEIDRTGYTGNINNVDTQMENFLDLL